MSATEEGGFEGPLPSSIKPAGFPCYRRGGCDREEHCEGEGECLGVDPPPAGALGRNYFNEIAEMVRALTYAEMIEFAGALWKRGNGKVNNETLPAILHAWATNTEVSSDCAVHNGPALRAGECDCGAGKKFQPIDTAPTDRPILAFMLGRWRIARWRPDHPHKKPTPFWSADDLRVTVSRAHQPKWWADLPLPPEAEV